VGTFFEDGAFSSVGFRPFSRRADVLPRTHTQKVDAIIFLAPILSPNRRSNRQTPGTSPPPSPNTPPRPQKRKTPCTSGNPSAQTPSSHTSPSSSSSTKSTSRETALGNSAREGREELWDETERGGECVWGGVEGGVGGSWVLWVLYFARTSKFHDPLHLRHIHGCASPDCPRTI
jgi:hypothetical protein